jgi:copper chaperone CopZ
MTIEACLERIATALERIAAGAMVDSAVEATIPSPKVLPAPAVPEPEAEETPQEDLFGAEPEEKPVEKPAAPKIEAVREALVKAQERVGADKARKILKDVGGTQTLGQLKPEKFAAVIEAAKKVK